MKQIRAFLPYYRSQRWRIATATAITFVATLLEASLLIILVPLAQLLVTPGAAPISVGPLKVTMSSGWMLVVAAGLTVANLGLGVLGVWVGAKATAEWQYSARMRLFRAFQATDWATQSGDREGKLLTVSGPNVNQGASGLALVIAGCGAMFSLVVLIGTAFAVSALGALLIIVGGGTLFALLRPLGGVTRRLNKQMSRLNVAIGGEVSEFVRFAREVRVFGVADEADARVEALVGEQERVRPVTMFIGNSLNPLYRAGGALLVLGVIWYGTVADTVTGASLGAAALLLYRSLGYGQAVQRASHAAHETLPYLEDMQRDLDLYESHSEPDGTREMPRPEQISYRDVSFSYDGEGAALDHVSVDLAFGEIVGVVGRSGSGKSTMAQLLLRLRQPTAGTLEVDGIPAGEFTAASWRRQVALVPQEAHLLHGTVADNIGFLRPWVDRDAIERAAKAAGIHDEIVDLPHGYDTQIGSTTRDLSGGQVQRISIARALAGEPSVLVLDEPTSALDVHSEAIVQQTIDSLRQHLLVVIIAHRLSTLSVCDRLLVLKQGRVERCGPREDVMRDAAFFATTALES